MHMNFCNGHINIFTLLLRKGIYPYEYMDSWEEFDETTLPNKKGFYSELNIEEITDKDHTHAQNTTCMFEVIHYCLQMYLKTLETIVFQYINLILLIFCLHLDISMASLFKKDRNKI